MTDWKTDKGKGAPAADLQGLTYPRYLYKADGVYPDGQWRRVETEAEARGALHDGFVVDAHAAAPDAAPDAKAAPAAAK